jgi:hypothetical protein
MRFNVRDARSRCDETDGQKHDRQQMVREQKAAIHNSQPKRRAMRSYSSRKLQTPEEFPATRNELMDGRRIVLSVSAGPRLSGKQGLVLGRGTTANQVRVLLDGSKSPITLHIRFIEMLGSPPAET